MSTSQSKQQQPLLPLKQRYAIIRTIIKPIRLLLIRFQIALNNPQKPQSISCLILLIASIIIIAQFGYYAFVNILSIHQPDLSLDLNDSNHWSNSSTQWTKKYDSAWTMIHKTNDNSENTNFVSIAYFIQAAGNCTNLLPRLFSRIHHPRHVYIVHMDTKIPSKNRWQIVNLVNSNSNYAKNIHFLDSEMITYKGITMVTNTIAAMTLALEKDKSWKYFINLSGVDYPLVSPQNQGMLLARPKVAYGHLNFITFFPKKEWKPYEFRIRNMHWDPADAGKQSPKSKLYLLRSYKTNPLEKFRSFTFTKAEAWMILSRPFVQFIVRSSYAKRMLVNHVHVLSVPEHYFANVLYNHPIWKSTIVSDAFRKVLWYLNHNRSGQHPHVLDQGATVLSRWSYIEETKSLFARKISIPNSALLDKIDTEMNGYLSNNQTNQLISTNLARQVFYQRIVSHFDKLTQATLKQQEIQWPSHAYPKL